MQNNPSFKRVLKQFPVLFQIKEGMLIYDLFEGLSKEFDRINQGLEYTFGSHMVNLSDRDRMSADEPNKPPFNLQKLACLFDIRPETNESAKDFRRRLKDLISIYLSGLGTVDAVLKMAALHYRFDLSRLNITRPTVQNPFVTTGVVTAQDGIAHTFEVIENPDQRKQLKPADIYNGIILEIKNNGMLDVVPTIELTTSGKALAYPIITNLTTGQQLFYKGVIPKNSVFIATPTADGNDYLIKIGNRPLESGDGILQGSFFDKGTFDRDVFADKGKAIIFPRGVNYVRIDLKQPTYNQAVFNGSSFYSEPVGQFNLKRHDQCGFPPINPFGKIVFSWIEKKAAAFKLNLPLYLYTGEPKRTARIKQFIDGIKSAGVESVIATQKTLDREHVNLSDRMQRIAFSVRKKERIQVITTLKKTVNTASGISERQHMSEWLRFNGAFDVMRFETSVFV